MARLVSVLAGDNVVGSKGDTVTLVTHDQRVPATEFALDRFGPFAVGKDRVRRIMVRRLCGGLQGVGMPEDVIVRAERDDGCASVANFDLEQYDAALVFRSRRRELDRGGLGPRGQCPVCCEDDPDAVAPIHVLSPCGHGVCVRCIALGALRMYPTTTTNDDDDDGGRCMTCRGATEGLPAMLASSPRLRMRMAALRFDASAWPTVRRAMREIGLEYSDRGWTGADRGTAAR